MTVGICVHCQTARDPVDVVAHWPVGRPEARLFVCRPSINGGICFRATVGPAHVHAIASTPEADAQRFDEAGEPTTPAPAATQPSVTGRPRLVTARSP